MHSSRCLSVMPSFLSRIRHRGPNTRPSTSTQPVPPPPAPVSSDTIPNFEVPADVTPSPLIGLKIRPDLNSLLESYETEDLSPKHQSKGDPVAVPPSPTQGGYSLLPPKPYVSRNVSTKSPELTTPVASTSTGRPGFPIFSETSPLSGTFGRQEFHLTKLGSIGSPHHEAPTRSRSFGDATNTNQTLTSAQRTGWNPTPTNQLPLSGTFEMSSSVRSLPDRKRRIDRRRGGNTRSLDSLRTTRSSFSARHRSHQMSTPVVHQHRPESPMTFGYPTPPYSTRTFGHHESPPPPLPPLDHPELTFDARGSGSVSLGKSLKPSNSTSTIPHVTDIFGTPQEPASGPSVGGKSVVRKKSKTQSVDSRRSSRRSSAEWSAVQATEGILTHSNNWQAQVSREILRLSFGESAPSTGDPGNVRDAPHVAATQLPPAKTVVSPRPPPSLGSPLFLQGRPNPSSAIFRAQLNVFLLSPDFNPASPSSEFRAADRAAVTGDEHDEPRRMTEQETPALQVSSGPSDTKGRPPLKSSLRASSTPRYSAISTVLATPTRSRNLSSDSGVTKGKRKADEVDTTPPDQKSLHATFAVPEDLPCESPLSFLPPRHTQPCHV